MLFIDYYQYKQSSFKDVTLHEDLVNYVSSLKADIQSVELSERAEIRLFVGDDVALKFNRYLRLSNYLLSKIPPARKIPLTGNWP